MDTLKTNSKPSNSSLEEVSCGPTPMMKQYFSIKQKHEDCLLFYRMGDFYELFFDDATKAATTLDIALTKRGKHLGSDIPMCGVPVHSHETYLNKLIKEGYCVAICDQLEDPKKTKERGKKAIVKRDVTRIITPGTLTEDSLLSPRKNNYLAAIGESEGRTALAWIDISTGQFFSQLIEKNGLMAALARIDPGELLVSESQFHRQEMVPILSESDAYQTILCSSSFDSIRSGRILKDLYNILTLDAFGKFSKAELVAAGAVVEYINSTQKGKMPRIGKLSRVTESSILEIDAATRRNLELFSTLSGEYKGSLVSVIDRTVTGSGGRLLAIWLTQPLTSPDMITSRLDMVDTFIKSDQLRFGLVRLLKKVPDIERALSRLSLGRGGPRDLAVIFNGIELASAAKKILEEEPLVLSTGLVAELKLGLDHHKSLTDLLRAALNEELPLVAREGGFVKMGYSKELDNLLELRDKSRRLIVGLEQKYSKLTGLSKLKIKHNNVLGFFIEVTPKSADKVPIDKDSPFIHRQSLTTATRFGTVELSELENKIAQAAEQVLILEIEVFEFLVSQVLDSSETIALCAQRLAELDVYVGLAVLAVEKRYVRPTLDDSTNFFIKNGRHPVVETMLGETSDKQFIKNHCKISGGSENTEGVAQVWLLSGPNMAGKSTFLRQCALISIMAQMGSYVPADSAKIGVIDRLFSRVGASDDLARGRSTFMVEMVETATILNHASPRSMVILDEIGRGTATFDGLSIAWAVIEHLHEKNKCRTLFATHYHELTALRSTLKRLECHTMKVKEWKEDVVFLHEVIAGAADRSYGIHVGSLAGLPEKVVARAKQILNLLESDEKAGSAKDLANDLPLFNSFENPSRSDYIKESLKSVWKTLEELNIDEMTPKQAHDFLYDLKSKISDKN